MKAEVKTEVKSEVKVEVKQEVKQEIKQESADKQPHNMNRSGMGGISLGAAGIIILYPRIRTRAYQVSSRPKAGAPYGCKLELAFSFLCQRR